MVAAAGAGPKPIHHKSLTAQNLSEAISYCLTPQASAAAAQIASKMSTETGVRTAVDSFHSHLPLADMMCDILPDEPAVWRYSSKKVSIKLSKKAAEALRDGLKVDGEKLEL
jgi:hypothetical protein